MAIFSLVGTMPVRKKLLNILANHYWFTICGAICLTMYESMLSNHVDFFDLIWRIILLISFGMVGEQKKISGFDSIISIGSLSVCGKFAASLFPTVVKYVLKLFAMSVLSVQGTPLDVIKIMYAFSAHFVMYAFSAPLRNVNHCSVTTQVIQSMVCTIRGIIKVVIIYEASIEREKQSLNYTDIPCMSNFIDYTASIQSSLQMRLLSFVPSCDSLVIAECWWLPWH